MPQDTGVEALASLGSEINKDKKNDTQKEVALGVVSDKLPELRLEMEDDALLKLTEKWLKSWNDSQAKKEWETQIEENEKYWQGKQFEKIKADTSRAMVDNLIFEALETFLPQATRRNPEPLVLLDNSEENDQIKESYIQHVKLRLGDLADKNKLRLKLKKSIRFWAIYHLGIAKIGWDVEKDMPVVKTVRPRKIILDPEATIDEDGYTGSHVGEYRRMEAFKLLEHVTDEANKEFITELVKGDMATEVQFIEWWTNEYVCWVLDKHILLKNKNPHWNYNQTVQNVAVDEYGNETSTQQEVPGINHFTAPLMPYVFLSVFNLGDQPMDKTSLISQNLANQDLINKRNKQIDKNADSMNGGMVVSLARSGLTQDQAKKVTDALRKGGTVVIPDGAPRDAVERYPANGLPADVFNQLVDTRERLRDIFGIRGSSAAGLETEKTVRGKFLNQQTDTDRIGGGITEYLEQHADDIFNWFLQMLYVYDSRFQFVNGNVPAKLVISVKEGSLLPKDSMTIANQSVELAVAGKMSLIDLYKKLEYPNPEEMASNTWLEANAPELLYANDPRIAMVVQQRASAAKPPSESISYKDLPPEGKAQMAAQAGITVNPESIMAEDTKRADEKAKAPIPEIK